MKGLDSLIRLHKWKLDEKRRTVTDLEKLAAGLRREITDLEAEITAEQGIARANGSAAATYGNYAARAIERRDKLQRSLAGIETGLAEALEEVADAFREFKKFDLIQARDLRRAAERERRAQQTALDEAGLDLYRRRET